MPQHPATFEDVTGGGTGGDIESIPKGALVTDSKNNSYIILSEPGEPLRGALQGTASKTGGNFKLPPGEYFIGQQSFNLTGSGQIIGTPQSRPAGLPSDATLVNGWPWHQFPDGTAKPFTKQEAEAAGFGGGGGGPSRVGVRAPDPLGAATILFRQYDAEIERGTLTADDAAAAWQRDFDEIATNRDIAAEKFAAQQRLEDTATRRGELEFDILKSSLPIGASLNLGPFGVVPENRVNVQELLTQGLPPLATQFQNVSDELTPITGLPDVAPLELPDRSLLSQIPGLASATAGGSAGFLV